MHLSLCGVRVGGLEGCEEQGIIPEELAKYSKSIALSPRRLDYPSLPFPKKRLEISKSPAALFHCAVGMSDDLSEFYSNHCLDWRLSRLAREKMGAHGHHINPPSLCYNSQSSNFFSHLSPSLPIDSNYFPFQGRAPTMGPAGRLRSFLVGLYLISVTVADCPTPWVIPNTDFDDNSECPESSDAIFRAGCKLRLKCSNGIPCG